jgi:hypothetical protein
MYGSCKEFAPDYWCVVTERANRRSAQTKKKIGSVLNASFSYIPWNKTDVSTSVKQTYITLFRFAWITEEKVNFHKANNSS